MRSLIAVATIVLLLPLGAAAGETASASGSGPAYARPDLLVETAWLDENIIRPDLLIVDVRDRGRYDARHIPGSYWLDVAKLVKRGGGPPQVVPAEEFKALVESAGIGDGTHVIAVDDSEGQSAAALWWALGYYGFDKVSVLNGGHQKWESEGRAATVEYPYSRTVTFTPRPRPERGATAEQVKEWRSKPGGVILDARSPAAFSGAHGLGSRKGRIPGAVNVPCEENLEARGGGRVFKPAAELLEIYRKAGVTKDSRVVAYDVDGRGSTHLLFTIALIGLNPGGANYVGGWREWARRTDLPIEGQPAGGSKARAKSKAKGGS